MLCVCAGSSVDQQSNNVSLFSLVEHVNIPPMVTPPGRGAIPVEAHTYWRFEPTEMQRDLQVRYVMVNLATQLETSSDTLKHRAVTARVRSRLAGIPFPPVVGNYELRVDWRWDDQNEWTRTDQAWPLTITEGKPQPRVTH